MTITFLSQYRAPLSSHSIGEYLVTITQGWPTSFHSMSHSIGEYIVTITADFGHSSAIWSHSIGEYPVTITCGLRFACPVT